MTAQLAGTLGRLLSTVDYLRVTVGEPPGDREWLASSAMTSDPERLAAVVRSTAADRGTDRGDVAMSLFVQGYAFRVASIAIGAWLLDDIVVDVAPRRCAIALRRHRPNAVHFDELRAVAGGDPLAALHEVLVEGHLAPLLDNARAACRIGQPLLWSNVGAACASSFGALMLARRDLHGEIRNRFEAFLATARPELSGSGRVVHVGPVWAWERSACCLWYKTESGFKCEDCSLWTQEERQVRYDRVLAGLNALTCSADDHSEQTAQQDPHRRADPHEDERNACAGLMPRPADGHAPVIGRTNSKR